MKRVTITDVAKKAGVSISTASKALADDGSISKKTADKVREVAREIEYTPNRAARFLSRKEKRIGILIAENPREVMSHIEDGLISTLEEYGKFGLDYEYATYRSLTELIEKLELLLPHICGLIFMPGYELGSYIDYIKAIKVPVITLLTGIDTGYELGFDCFNVSINEIVVGKMAAEFLGMNVRCKNVAVITGYREVYIHKKNIEGFVSQLDEYNLKLVCIEESHDDMETAYKLTKQLFSRHTEIGGIFVTSYVAPGVCRYLKEAEIADKVCVIGMDVFDGTVACMRDGSLNAIIYQNQFMQGKIAVDNMFNTINGIPMTSDEKIKPELVLRSNLECYLK